MSKTQSVAVQMKELLDQIDESVQDAAKRGINETAKEAVQKLRNTSPRKTGSYARGWGTKKDGDMTVTVYNRTDYQLTHLLENGHVVRNKKGTYGRVGGKKHIAPVEEWAASELPIQIKRGIK